MLEIFLMIVMSIAVAYISFHTGREYGMRSTYHQQEEIIDEQMRFINELLHERRSHEDRENSLD